MKLYCQILIGLLLVFSQTSKANEALATIEPWLATNNYQRGHMVEHNGVAYIALLPSKNIQPQKVSILWRPINLQSSKPPKKGKLYLLGEVVINNGIQYITRELNILGNLADLQNKKKWIAYQGKPLTPEPLNDDPIQLLLGEDKNNNGVRDDFEELILSSELSEEAKQHALQAGKAYSSTMKLSTIKDQISIVQAQKTVQLMINAYRCKIEIARKEGSSWRESDFYNDIDRLETKFIFSNFLDQLAGEDYPYDFSSNPCSLLALAIEEI